MKINHVGFTLLEVIVALTLLATAGVASYSLINSSLMNMNHVKEKFEMVEMSRNALAYVETINPMLKPDGDVQLGAYQVQWQADRVTEITPGSGMYSGSSLYELALYNTTVTVTQEEQAVAKITVRLVGYRQTTPFTLPF